MYEIKRRFIYLLIVFVLLLTGCDVLEEVLSEEFYQQSTGDFVVTYIDIGQADSILIEKNGRFMLIDSGDIGTRDELVQFLEGQGVSRLDYVIGTHPHADHIGGLDRVIATFDIGAIYMPKVTATTKVFERVTTEIANKGLKVTTPIAGDSFLFEDVKFTIVAPNSESYENMNNYSIILRADYKDTSFLFTGDAEAISEAEVLDNGWDISVDVLKIGHHGSSTSTTEDFLLAVDPQIAIISCGKDNSYGHPHREIVKLLENYEIPFYRTDVDGNITITSDGESLYID